jgi:hypothetical protein
MIGISPLWLFGTLIGFLIYLPIAWWAFKSRKPFPIFVAACSTVFVAWWASWFVPVVYWTYQILKYGQGSFL